MAAVLKTDDSTESHEYVIMNMIEIRKKNEYIKDHVQWKKLNNIDESSKDVEKRARDGMMIILQYEPPDVDKSSKKYIRDQQKNNTKLAKNEKAIETKTESIVW